MYRVKVFKAHVIHSEELEKEINEFLIGKDIEVVDCKITCVERHVVYVIIYKVW